MSFIMNWEPAFYQKTDLQREQAENYEKIATQYQSVTDKSAIYMAMLQNIKYVGKRGKTVPDLAAYLEKFEFIEDLMKEHLGEVGEQKWDQYTIQLPRKSSDFVGFLENPFKGKLTNDYISFMMEKLEEKKKFEKIINMKKNEFQLYKVLTPSISLICP